MEAEISTHENGAGQSQLSELSNGMVRLYKEQFGRGPTRAKTSYADRDTIICTLRDSMTPAERNLVAMGSTSACAT